MKYTVKTRNWNGKRAVAVVLNIFAAVAGVACYKSENDHDHKYYLETKNGLRAWIAWSLFMTVRPLSGGWTYIVCGEARPDMHYKAIYR